MKIIYEVKVKFLDGEIATFSYTDQSICDIEGSAVVVRDKVVKDLQKIININNIKYMEVKIIE